ncbi:MAG: long-chain fatty acid--CoA ligase, partial [Sphingomicrobium sp.]
EFSGRADLPQLLGKAVDRVNAELSIVEKVRRFIIADGPFTIDNEQLTPSMKIRRHVIKQTYGERLDGLYKK